MNSWLISCLAWHKCVNKYILFSDQNIIYFSDLYRLSNGRNSEVQGHESWAEAVCDPVQGEGSLDPTDLGWVHQKEGITPSLLPGKLSSISVRIIKPIKTSVIREQWAVEGNWVSGHRRTLMLWRRFLRMWDRNSLTSLVVAVGGTHLTSPIPASSG